MLLLLGLLLLGATGAFIGLLIADNTGGPDYTVTVLDKEIATLDGLGIFLAGIALTLILGLALAMIKAGVTRSRRRRQRAHEAPAPADRETGEWDAPGGHGGHGGHGSQGGQGGQGGYGAQGGPYTRSDASAAPGDDPSTAPGRHPRRPFHFGE
ncbi:hypothetical protein ABZX98_26990 [Streptomyces sp. NPDC002992]|uniref:hypothetical protein n=1 Tax=Streptomyces sp. NPDC002992 TaxID=3154273 RepID=UPI0033AC45BD